MRTGTDYCDEPFFLSVYQSIIYKSKETIIKGSHMKPLFIILFSIYPCINFSQESLHQSKIEHLNFLDLYFFCKPQKEFNIEYIINTRMTENMKTKRDLKKIETDAKSMLNPDILFQFHTNETLKSYISKLERSAIDNHAKPFDAVYSPDGYNFYFISYLNKDKVLEQFVNVTKIQNKEIYLFSEPTKKYTIIRKLKESYSSLIQDEYRQTQGQGYFTIGDLTMKLLDKAFFLQEKGKFNSFDAIYSKDGENVYIIKYEL